MLKSRSVWTAHLNFATSQVSSGFSVDYIKTRKYPGCLIKWPVSCSTTSTGRSFVRLRDRQNGLKAAGRIMQLSEGAFLSTLSTAMFFFLIVLVHFRQNSFFSRYPGINKRERWNRFGLQNEGEIPTGNALRLCLLPRSAQLFIATGQTRRAEAAGRGRETTKNVTLLDVLAGGGTKRMWERWNLKKSFQGK